MTRVWLDEMASQPVPLPEFIATAADYQVPPGVPVHDGSWPCGRPRKGYEYPWGVKARRKPFQAAGDTSQGC